MEFFDYKTASQYAGISSPSNGGFSEQKGKEEAFQVEGFQPSEIPPSEANGSHILRNQIGFKTNPHKQSKSLLEQEKTDIKTIVIDDRKTILHNGKYYTLEGVNNFINIYQNRVKGALQKGRSDLANSREETLKYWQGRKEELLTKMG